MNIIPVEKLFFAKSVLDYLIISPSYIYEISVYSNANPLHYYALRVPRKAERWR